MSKEELWKIVDREANWLSYYGFRADLEKVDLNYPIYEQIRSIGYAKVTTELDIRCNGWLCYRYVEGMSVDDLKSLNERRNPNENKFSPIEIWLLLYPKDKEMIYKKINKL